MRVWHTRQRQNIISAGFGLVDLLPQLSGCMAHLEEAGQQRGLQADYGTPGKMARNRDHHAVSYSQPKGWAQASQGWKVIFEYSILKSVTNDGEGGCL